LRREQTFIATYSKVTFTKLYIHKNAFVAADLLHDKVVPFFQRKLIIIKNPNAEVNQH